jgi:hypothetical protein
MNMGSTPFDKMFILAVFWHGIWCDDNDTKKYIFNEF